MNIHNHGNEPDPRLNAIIEGLAVLTEAVLLMREELGEQMSELSDAVQAVKQRVEVDVQHLRDRITELGDELTTAAANDAADAAEIERLNGLVSDAKAEADQAVANLNAIDPDPDNPPADTPPVDQPPAEEPPAEPGQ